MYQLKLQLKYIFVNY